MRDASTMVLVVVVLIQVAYARWVYNGLRTADPAWRARFLAGAVERKRRRHRLIWASAAVLAVGWLAYYLVRGRTAVDVRWLQAAYALLGIAVATAWTIGCVAEHRWYRRDGAPRSFLSMYVASTLTVPIGIVLYVALRLG